MKTITAALFAAALSGAALAAPSPALAAPPPLRQDQQWCPGQQWDEEWGVNMDRKHCHSVDLGDDDPDLDAGVPNPDLGQGLPPKYQDGDYPPDYDWSEQYGDDHGHH
ncbi:MAG: hypothetical protein ACRC20_13880 [Segniliparus sp.]|uniref:hypothetical protein n=1 Tax=Segniliparus sp. TaxID=2804064 RepID=UPI003F2D8B9D